MYTKSKEDMSGENYAGSLALCDTSAQQRADGRWNKNEDRLYLTLVVSHTEVQNETPGASAHENPASRGSI